MELILHTLSSYSTDPHDLQGSDDQLRLSPLLSLGNKVTPDQTPPAGKGVRPVGDSLLRCSSNPLWWAPGQLAFVGPDGCLQVVQVPSGEQVLYVDTHYFLPGSRIVASLGLYGQGRRMYVLSALIQAARYISLRPIGFEHAPLGVHCVGIALLFTVCACRIVAVLSSCRNIAYDRYRCRQCKAIGICTMCLSALGLSFWLPAAEAAAAFTVPFTCNADHTGGKNLIQH